MNIANDNVSYMMKLLDWPVFWSGYIYLNDFQVDVWALGVSAIEMAEVYPVLVFLILHFPSKLLVYPK